MEPRNIFSTPLWIIKGDIPKGMFNWCKEYEQNTPSNNISNRGGYQSVLTNGIQNIPFEYSDYLKEKLKFLPSFDFSNWWLNVNYKGDYNVTHTHPLADLIVIWYMTDNHELLYIRNPLAHQRWGLLNALNRDKEMCINATAGDIVIFPGDIEHSVEEHQLDDPRICLSFNLKLY